MRDFDIDSDLKQEKFQSLKLVQGDRGNKIKINVYEDGQPVNLAGCSVTAKYKRADGEIINDGVIENIHDNSFDAVMDSSITKVAGTLKMLFTIEKDDVKVSTFLLLADVRESIGENTGSSGGNTGGGSGEVTIDLSNYYKKIETYSKNQIDARFKDIAKKTITTEERNKLSSLENYDDTEIKSSINAKADKNAIFTMANMGQDIKEAMTGGSVAVVGKDAILTENIVDKQVVEEKTSFINVIESTNLFNIEKAILNKYQQNETAIIQDETRYMYKINIKEGDIIRATYNPDLANNPCQIFNKDGKRVGYKAILSDYTVVDNLYWQATMPTDANYIIINWKKTWINDNMLTINAEYPSEYIEYNRETILKDSVKIQSVDDLKESTTTLQDDVNHLKESTTTLQDDVNHLKESKMDKNILRELESVKISEGNSISINIPGKRTVIKNATIRLALHKSKIQNTNDWNEIFSDVFDKDFKGLRFFDGDKELNYHILNHGNYDFVKEYGFYTTSDRGILHFSDNSLVINRGGENGICKSTDNGATWIKLCGEINGKNLNIIFIDSNDNLYVMNNNDYKVYRYTPSDNYVTGTVCLDLTEKSQGFGDMQEAPNGYLFFGTYQSAYGIGGTVYRSIDNGVSFQKVLHVAEVQHVHNISINKYSNPVEIFVGFDHQDIKGARCYISKDYGETWENLDVPYRNRDYAFDFCEENLYLGCGEANILGGATLYKTSNYSDDKLYKTVANNKQGVRTIVKVGKNKLIAGGCAGGTNQIPQLYMSEDNGETWETIWADDSIKTTSSGVGVRFFTDLMTPMGATEEQMLISGYGQNYTLRCYFDGEFAYALVYVNVGDIPTTGKTITLKTGYLINKNCRDEMSTEQEGLAMHIKFDNKIVKDYISGKEIYVEDSLIDNKADLFEDSFLPRKIHQDNVLCLKDKSLNLGKLKNLSFNKGFTFSFWMKAKSYEEMKADTTRHPIIRFGNFKIAIKENKLVIYNNNNLLLSIELYIASLCSEGYNLYTFTVSDDDLPVISHISFDKIITTKVNASAWIDFNLSDYDCVFGNNDTTFYSDMYNIADFKIFNRILSDDEILSIFHKRNYYQK